MSFLYTSISSFGAKLSHIFSTHHPSQKKKMSLDDLFRKPGYKPNKCRKRTDWEIFSKNGEVICTYKLGGETRGDTLSVTEGQVSPADVYELITGVDVATHIPKNTQLLCVMMKRASPTKCRNLILDAAPKRFHLAVKQFPFRKLGEVLCGKSEAE